MISVKITIISEGNRDVFGWQQSLEKYAVVDTVTDLYNGELHVGGRA